MKPNDMPVALATNTEAETRLHMSSGFYRTCCALLLASGLLLLWINQGSGYDLKLADYYYDTQQHDFPWRETWFAATFMHIWLKNLIIAAGVPVLIFCLFDAIRPQTWLSTLRRTQLRIVALASIFIPFLIKLVKHHSALQCPWDLNRYGGDTPYMRLLDHIPPGWEAGHCFPAGHASSGLWLAALAVLWLPRQPVKAFVVFWLGLGVGLAMGWVQQMRGAHFLSHTLWAGWIAAALLLCLIRLFDRH
jgi:membrane-associated PAP2 superfamily phosphatase